MGAEGWRRFLFNPRALHGGRSGTRSQMTACSPSLAALPLQPLPLPDASSQVGVLGGVGRMSGGRVGWQKPSVVPPVLCQLAVASAAAHAAARPLNPHAPLTHVLLFAPIPPLSCQAGAVPGLGVSLRLHQP